jgi:hypothetical protein
MKTTFARFSLGTFAAASAAMLTGCAVSPDYSHYDWSARGGMVDEQDRSLAGARIEPFNMRRAQTDEQIVPSGAPTAREAEVVIDPGDRRTPIAQPRSTTVVRR